MTAGTLLRAWMAPILVAGVAHAGLAFVPFQMSGSETPSRPKPVRVALQPPPEPPELEEVVPEPPPEPPVEVPAEPPPEPAPPPPPPKAVKRAPPKANRAPPVAKQAPAEPPPSAAVAVPNEAEAAEVTEASSDLTPPAPEAPSVSSPTEERPEVPAAPAPSVAAPDLGPYRRGLRRSLMSHRRYPRVAVEMEYEGVAWVRLVLDRLGALVGEPVLVKSSGHPLLDTEALRMVRAAAPFAAMPEGVREASTTFDVPIRFSLDR